MKEYTFKPLTTDDIIPLCKIIRGIGVNTIKNELKQLDFKPITNSGKKTDENTSIENANIGFAIDIAVAILGIITTNMDKIHEELKKLLANKTDVTIDEITKLPFDEYTNMIFSFCKREEFVNFFTVVSKSLGLTI